MHKGISILVSAILVSGLAGCSGNKTSDNSTNKLTTKRNDGQVVIQRTNGPAVFVSNAALDRHVIFQSFSLYQPYDSKMYATLAHNSARLAQWGVTDVWMPPAYRAFSQSYYGEGYAIMDRYDLGEFAQGLNGAKASKYGTSAELKQTIAILHKKGLRVQEDLVPNQMMGLPNPEIVSVTAVDQTGKENDANVKNQLVKIYSKGGGLGQQKYGLIKEWNHTFYNGTGTQQLGMFRLMVDTSLKPYRYYGAKDARNYLPDWLAKSDAQAYGKINSIDNYLTVDGYYAVKGANTQNDQVWRPLLLYYVDSRKGVATQSYLDFMKANGYSGSSDDAVRGRIIAADSATVSKLTDQYLSSQPGYSAASEPKSLLRFNNGVNDHVNRNVLQYEFLIGNDIDNSNAVVQKEQLNWQKFLLDRYGFDGFRIDAASHFNTKVLTDARDLMSARYGKDLSKHLSYIESYTDNQLQFENSNRNGQLVYDHKVFGALRSSLGMASGGSPLRDVIGASYVNRTDPRAARIPNWSFVNNHDQEHNVLALIPLTAAEAGGATAGTPQYEAVQFKKYSSDMENTDKRYTPHNMIGQYAYLLTNKDTVPSVYYGDMFKADQPYMSAKTIYYDTLVKLLSARKKYVSGDQKIFYYPSNTSATAGNDLIGSVRYGTNRDTGAAVVIGNNPNTNTAIDVDMGRSHARQTFVDATGINKVRLATDAKGILTVPVQGMRTPLVNGYLGVWVPSAETAGGRKLNNGRNGVLGKAVRQPGSTHPNYTGHKWQQDREARRSKGKKWSHWKK